MGFLNLFKKSAPAIPSLPLGSFTLDRTGRVLGCTLPSDFPGELIEKIGREVMNTFREAKEAQLPLAELNIRFGSLKISARELRGGAIIFLAPKTPITPSRQT